MNANQSMFEVFPWNKSFETGNAMIDEQHQILIALLNKLAVSLINQDESQLNTIFDELIEYANMHFVEEEKIWLKYFPNDPWLLSHQNTHSSFLPSVMEIKNQTPNLPLPDIIEKVVHYLLKWLVLHIIESDKRMVMAINAIESGSSIDEAKQLAENKMTGANLALVDTMLNMYENLSSKSITLMREIKARKKAENQLNHANKQLEALIITDPLTSLFNRRHFDNSFKLKLRKAIRDQKLLCFMLIDIDFFKNINDSYGHLAGDQALIKLGACLLELCRRPDDMIFRIGGEEFGILTSNESTETASNFAEKIRKTVEELNIPNKQSKISDYMTISIGGIHKVPGFEDSQDKLVKLADKALYQAKTSGRNKTIISH